MWYNVYDWFVLFLVLFLPAFLDWFWSIRFSNSPLGSYVLIYPTGVLLLLLLLFIYLSMINRLIHSFIHKSIHSSNPSIILSIYCTCHELPFIWCRFVMSCHVNACRIHVKNLKFLISEFSISCCTFGVLFSPVLLLLCSNQKSQKISEELSWVESSRG